MRKLILMTTCAVLVTAQLVAAAEVDKAQMEKIKAARSTVVNKMPALADLFDNEHNGVNASWAPVQAAFTEANAKLNKSIQEESAKPAEAQDKQALGAWQAKVARLQTYWADRNQKWWPAWSAKFNTANGVRMQLGNLVANQANQDQAWLKAGCDPAMLAAMFNELDKRVEDVKVQGNALVAEALKQSEDDEKMLKE